MMISQSTARIHLLLPLFYEPISLHGPRTQATDPAVQWGRLVVNIGGQRRRKRDAADDECRGKWGGVVPCPTENEFFFKFYHHKTLMVKR